VEHLTQKGPALGLTYKLTELGGDKHSSLFFKKITNLDKTFVTLALAGCTIKHFTSVNKLECLSMSVPSTLG
jgi:hypothetical protein